MRDEQSLTEIYKNAITCLDGVENKLNWLSNSSDKVCLSIIADDLESIVEECESYFISGTSALNLPSIQNRYETVLEELHCIVS